MNRIPRKVAVLGLGMAVQPHALSLIDLQAEGWVNVVGGWSRSAAQRATFAERYGLPVVPDLDGPIRRAETVLLLTPPDARTELVGRCTSAGRPILMESPSSGRLWQPRGWSSAARPPG